MKIQKSVINVKKSLKINMLKHIRKLGTIVIMQVNIEVLQIMHVF